MSFCESTNARTSMKLDDALAKLRAELIEGYIEQGEALPKLTKRVNSIFDGLTKQHAELIAHTETTRAVHAASLMSAKETGGVEKKQWLLSSDACPICHSLGAKGGVPLNGLFGKFGDHPEYSEIQMPPAHPGCRCTVVYIFTDEYQAIVDEELGPMAPNGLIAAGKDPEEKPLPKPLPPPPKPSKPKPPPVVVAVKPIPKPANVPPAALEPKPEPGELIPPKRVLPAPLPPSPGPAPTVVPASPGTPKPPNKPKNADGFVEFGDARTAEELAKVREYHNSMNTFAKSGLTPQERAAVKNYTGSGYIDINCQLRGAKYSDKDYTDQIKLLDSAMAKTRIKEDLIVYRGIGSLPPGLATTDDKGKEHFIGAVFKEPGFTSASLNKKTAKNFASHAKGAVFEIRLPKGSRAGSVAGSTHFDSEMEVVIDRSTSFKVVGVKQFGKYRVFEVEIIQPELGAAKSLEGVVKSDETISLDVVRYGRFSWGDGDVLVLQPGTVEV